MVRRLWHSKAVHICRVICRALLAVWIVGMLSEGSVRQQIPVSPASFGIYTNRWSKGHVGLEGTWVMENEKPDFPLQVSKIVCQSDQKTCVESRAEVGGTTLMVNQDVYEITRWDDHILIYGDTSGRCADYVYTVSRDTKQVSGIRTIKAGMENICPDMVKEMKLQLTNGFNVYWEMRKEAMPLMAGTAALLCILLWAGFRIRKIIKSQPPVPQS